MKKEEIIKQMIGGAIYTKVQPSGAGWDKDRHEVVDLDKLAKFLTKYVAKEDLIID